MIVYLNGVTNFECFLLNLHTLNYHSHHLPNAHYVFFQSPPYSMYRDSQKRLTGNDVFEGYAIDLIKNISEILSKFKQSEK